MASTALSMQPSQMVTPSPIACQPTIESKGVFHSVASIQHAAKIVVGMPRFTDNTLCLDSDCAAKPAGVEDEKDFARRHGRCCIYGHCTRQCCRSKPSTALRAAGTGF